jgi:hypothetical protein
VVQSRGRYGRRSSRGGADRPDDADSRRRGGAGRGEAAARPIQRATMLGWRSRGEHHIPLRLLRWIWSSEEEIQTEPTCASERLGLARKKSHPHIQAGPPSAISLHTTSATSRASRGCYNIGSLELFEDSG